MAYPKEEREGNRPRSLRWLVDNLPLHTRQPEQYTWWTSWGACARANVAVADRLYLCFEGWLKKLITKAEIHP